MIDTAAEKSVMRKRAKALLSAIGPQERARSSARAATLFHEAPGYADAALVLAFLSMPSEIDTEPTITAAFNDGKRVAVPRIEADAIAFIALPENWKEWPLDRWHIPEPPAQLQSLLFDDIAATATIALIPGLAFDTTGGRLGRGKAYYDRFLSRLEAARQALGEKAGPFAAIAFGYESQLVESVPRDAHDRLVDGFALG